MAFGKMDPTFRGDAIATVYQAASESGSFTRVVTSTSGVSHSRCGVPTNTAAPFYERQTEEALQQKAIARRIGCSPATAALLAELAFPGLDRWEVRS